MFVCHILTEIGYLNGAQGNLCLHFQHTYISIIIKGTFFSLKWCSSNLTNFQNMQIKIFKFNSLRLVYVCCSKNLLPFQFQISDLNYQSDTKDKHQTLKKKLELSFIKSQNNTNPETIIETPN